MDKFDFPVFIFGAGATIGSGYYLDGDSGKKPPGNEDFFKVLNTSWQYRVPALMAVCNALNIKIQEISLEMLWNYIYITRRHVEESLMSIVDRLGDFGIKQLLGQYPGEILSNGGISLDEKLSRLAEIDLIYLVWRVLKRLKMSKNEKDNYEKLFMETGLIGQEKELKKQFAVVSFNYDLCLEESLRKANDLFYYPKFRSIYKKDFIPIFKLHGSLNWKHGYDGNVRPTDDYRIMKEDEFVAKQAQLWPQAWKDYMPMIIPPTVFKEELYFPSGQERIRRHFTDLWREAYRLLCEASCLIIIGYSFPEADPHARWLLKAAGDKPSFVVNEYSGEKNKRKYEKIVRSCLNKVDAFCHEGFGQCFEEVKQWIYKRD